MSVREEEEIRIEQNGEEIQKVLLDAKEQMRSLATNFVCELKNDNQDMKKKLDEMFTQITGDGHKEELEGNDLINSKLRGEPTKTDNAQKIIEEYKAKQSKRMDRFNELLPSLDSLSLSKGLKEEKELSSKTIPSTTSISSTDNRQRNKQLSRRDKSLSNFVRSGDISTSIAGDVLSSSTNDSIAGKLMNDGTSIEQLLTEQNRNDSSTIEEKRTQINEGNSFTAYSDCYEEIVVDRSCSNGLTSMTGFHAVSIVDVIFNFKDSDTNPDKDGIVQLCGSWDDWERKYFMKWDESKNLWKISMYLSVPGQYAYKYIVNEKWMPRINVNVFSDVNENGAKKDEDGLKVPFTLGEVEEKPFDFINQLNVFSHTFGDEKKPKEILELLRL
ncbi:hypothetical protein SNEBB_005479 [Seison nebaliae]|nr:hypothetical protein SNEBB_005479 [Seison nebaliae]